MRTTMGGDGVVHSRYISFGLTTGASTQASGYITLAPAIHSVSNDPGGAVIRQYSNYVTRSSKIIYTPAVGTTTPGVVFIAYIDNPEIINKVINNFYTAGTLVNIVQNMSTCKSTPVWQSLEVSCTRPPRRKLFSVDTDLPASAETADRAIQGIWVIVTANVPASTVAGYLSEEYTAMGENLQPQFFTVQ